MISDLEDSTYINRFHVSFWNRKLLSFEHLFQKNSML